MTTHHVTSPAPYQLSFWLMAAIRIYQRLLSPLLGQSCRFSPTCSAYAHDAIGIHGAIGGSWLAIKRVARCNPWGGMGSDPVPSVVDPVLLKDAGGQL